MREREGERERKRKFLRGFVKPAEKVDRVGTRICCNAIICQGDEYN